MSSTIPLPLPAKLREENQEESTIEVQVLPLPPQKRNQVQASALLLAFMVILQSVHVEHQSAQRQAKELQANANEQESEIKKEAKLKYEVLKKSQFFTKKGESQATVKVSVLDNLEAHNSKISAEREDIGSKVNVLYQGANILETKLNSTVSKSQQSLQECASITGVLLNLTNRIAQI